MNRPHQCAHICNRLVDGRHYRITTGRCNRRVKDGQTHCWKHRNIHWTEDLAQWCWRSRAVVPTTDKTPSVRALTNLSKD